MTVIIMSETSQWIKTIISTYGFWPEIYLMKIRRFWSQLDRNQKENVVGAVGKSSRIMENMRRAVLLLEKLITRKTGKLHNSLIRYITIKARHLVYLKEASTNMHNTFIFIKTP